MCYTAITTPTKIQKARRIDIFSDGKKTHSRQVRRHYKAIAGAGDAFSYPPSAPLSPNRAGSADSDSQVRRLVRGSVHGEVEVGHRLRQDLEERLDGRLDSRLM